VRRLHDPRIPVLALLLALGCMPDRGDEATWEATTPGAGEDRIDLAAIEAGRLDPAWRVWAELDRRGRVRAHSPGASVPPTVRGAAPPGVVADTGEAFEGIAPATVNLAPRLPIPRDGGGPSVLHAQILLDRAGFSPGILDGRWGKNTEKAVYWFQHEHGLEPTGELDATTYDRLRSHAGDRLPIAAYRVTAADLEGPFVRIPEDVYEKAELHCLCYESPLEMMTERFHATPEVLGQLNPGVDLENLSAGTVLQVPDVGERPAPAPGRVIDRIVVSRQGYYTQALDAAGGIIYHFPSTLGSGYDPSPTGDYRVVAITHDPHFHYQPTLFHEVPDEEPEAMLPAGPNSPVGVVWMALSKPHYGIHGTSEPRSIGYTSSHGCVRLTNWDAKLLAAHTPKGTPVEFR